VHRQPADHVLRHPGVLRSYFRGVRNGVAAIGALRNLLWPQLTSPIQHVGTVASAHGLNFPPARRIGQPWGDLELSIAVFKGNGGRTLSNSRTRPFRASFR
jgi:hypothetical protein